MKTILSLLPCILAASVAAAQIAPTPAPEMNACGPADVRFHVEKSQGQPRVPALEPGSARIYVIEDLLTGNWSEPLVRIGVDGQWVGAAQGNSWSTFTVPAGQHHLCTDWQPGPIHSEGGRALYGFNTQADQTYYFRVRFAAVGDGYTNTYGILLEPINPDEGQYLLSRYPQAVSKATK